MDITYLVESVLVSGTATTLAVQIMKSRYFPLPVERSPRLSAFIVSVIASVITVTQVGVDWNNLHDWTQILPVVCGTLIVSAATYKAIYQEPKPAVMIQQNVAPEATGTQHIEPQNPPTDIQPR